MTPKPLVLQVLITELPTLMERKSKQKALKDKPELGVIFILRKGRGLGGIAKYLLFLTGVE